MMNGRNNVRECYRLERIFKGLLLFLAHVGVCKGEYDALGEVVLDGVQKLTCNI